jgi:hypothetical protein
MVPGTGVGRTGSQTGLQTSRWKSCRRIMFRNISFIIKELDFSYYSEGKHHRALRRILKCGPSVDYLGTAHSFGQHQKITVVGLSLVARQSYTKHWARCCHWYSTSVWLIVENIIVFCCILLNWTWAGTKQHTKMDSFVKKIKTVMLFYM